MGDDTSECKGGRSYFDGCAQESLSRLRPCPILIPIIATPPVNGQAEDSTLFNRAVQGVYELGSTFKSLQLLRQWRWDLSPETIVDIRKSIRCENFASKIIAITEKSYVSKVIVKSSNIETARIATMVGGKSEAFWPACL